MFTHCCVMPWNYLIVEIKIHLQHLLDILNPVNKRFYTLKVVT